MVQHENESGTKGAGMMMTAIEQPEAAQWCILRTSPGRTLNLAASLAAGGFEVWTPVETVLRRVQRGSKAKEERAAAMMPTFVFAASAHMGDLAAIIEAPSSPHPPFSLFTYFGRVPTIRDAEIGYLRGLEEQARKRTLRKQRHTFSAGERVTVNDGAWTGLSGKVVESDGKHALICFGSMRPIKIASFLLNPIGVNREHPALGNAA